MEAKMTNYTRTNGANARAQSWDDFEEEPRTGRRGTWMPLDVLSEQAYEASPQLRAMPAAPAAPRRSIFGPRQPKQVPTQPTRANSTRQAAPKRGSQSRQASGQ